jgi:ferredoxin
MHALHVDPDRCQGYARCVAFAPEAFELDEEGYASVSPESERIENVSHRIRTALANCPERAITLNRA